MTSGEGGVVTTDDDLVWPLGSRIAPRGQGMDPERRYFFPVVGFNFRMTNVAAAILCAQMTRRVRAGGSARTRVRDVRRPARRLRQVELQPRRRWAVRAPWMYYLLLRGDLADRRDEVMSELDRLGVETRPMFIPLHRMPPYSSACRPPLPVTDDLRRTRGARASDVSAMTADDARGGGPGALRC